MKSLKSLTISKLPCLHQYDDIKPIEILILNKLGKHPNVTIAKFNKAWLTINIIYDVNSLDSKLWKHFPYSKSLVRAKCIH